MKITTDIKKIATQVGIEVIMKVITMEIEIVDMVIVIKEETEIGSN